MTMLIAGHETTAAVLTWAVFLLAQVWFNFIGFTNNHLRSNVNFLDESYMLEWLPSIDKLYFPPKCELIFLMQNPSKMRQAVFPS